MEVPPGEQKKVVIHLENKKKLYVGNLPYSVDDAQLQEIFSPFGEIVEAVIITDKYRGNRSKGFGFVEFTDEAAAAKAIEEMHEKEVEGRTLVVNVARPPRDRDEAPAMAEEEA